MLGYINRKRSHALLSGVAYALGELRPVSADESQATCGVSSYSELNGGLIEVTKRTIQQTLQRAKREPAEVDAVLVVTESFQEFEGNATRSAQGGFHKARNMIFDAVADVGVRGAPVFCSTFGGSGNFLQAVFMAKPLVECGAVGCLLIVCADKKPAGESRVMTDAVAVAGDGVAACVLSREVRHGSDAYELEYINIVPFDVARNPGHWQRILVDMYKTIKVVAANCLESTRRQPDQYAWLLLGNFNVPNNRVYAKIVGFAEDRTFMKNVGRIGHVPSCDHLINLRDLATDVPLESGMPLLLVVNGPIACGAISLIVR